MRNKIGIVLFLTISFFAAAIESPAGTSRKPKPPLEIAIAPEQLGLTSADIKPGDSVAFTITARAQADLTEVVISVDLIGGVELVSGEASWKGGMVRGEAKVLTVTVRAPLKGAGAIKARIRTAGAPGPGFGAETRFDLGGEGKSKPAPKKQIKKDAKGRGVVEYR